MQGIVNNISNSDSEGNFFLIERGLFVQVLVGIFLYVNVLMILTFLKKEMFRENTRYILFAQTLFVDSAFLVFTDLLLIINFYEYKIPMIPCMIICIALLLLYLCTPLTLVAMCLECYVAICMPLRHAAISTGRTRLFGFLIIWGISSVVPLFTVISYLSVAPSNALFSYVVCSVELMLGEEWQAHTRAATLQVIFFVMILMIFFTYIKIMIAARAASSENKKSTHKGLRTVALHAFQLFLCVVQLLTPYIEMPFWNQDLMVFGTIRYCNFILFNIAPRCLSPLIYGMRDEKFFLVLRHYALWGFRYQTSSLQCKIRPFSSKTH